MIEVKVRFIGILHKAMGMDVMLMKLKESTSIGETLKGLMNSLAPEARRALIDLELDDPRPNVLILINGREVSALDGLMTKLNDGDEIVIIPVTHGG